MSAKVLYVKYFVILFCFYIQNSSCQASLNNCNHTEKSHKKKFANAPIVVIGKFLEFVQKDSNDQIQIAKFRFEKRLKGTFLHEADGIFTIPLYRRHDSMSKKVYCLSEKMLTINERYVLFLNRQRNTNSKQLTWKSVFMAEKLNENDERIMYDSVEVPYFDLQVNTDSTDGPHKRAEVRVGDPLYVRCTVNGDVHNEPSMSWNFNGYPVPAESDKRIETNHKTLTSTLKISKFDAFHHGSYECSVRRKDGKPKVTKLKVDIKEGNYTSLFDEQLCSSNYTDWCKHGGVCVVHKQTNAVSCRCAFGYNGVNCEYFHKAPPTSRPIHEGQNKNVITVSCVIGLALILSFAAFILFIKHRHQKNAKINKSSNLITTLCMQNNGRLPSIKEIDETKILLPQFQYCPTCHQEVKHKHGISNYPHSYNDHTQEKVESVINSSLLEQGNVTRSPDVRSHSIPGYFKMPDADHPKDNGLQFVRVPNATSLQVPRVRHLGTSEDDLESPKLYDQRRILSERRSQSIPGSLVSSSIRHSSQESEPTTMKTKHQKLSRTVQSDEFSSSEPNTPITDVLLKGKNREQYEFKNGPVCVLLADD